MRTALPRPLKRLQACMEPRQAPSARRSGVDGRRHGAKAWLLPVALLFAAPTLCAQLNAGDVPPGSSVDTSGTELELHTMFTTVTASFDVDCDGIMDFEALLRQGAPEIDSPNFCTLRRLHAGLELCADLDPVYWRPKYHALGEALDCINGFDWRSDSITVLGDIGTFMAMGPEVVDSQYVAFRNSGAVGWLLLSFNISAGGVVQGVSLTIHQVLVPCINLGIHDPTAPAAPTLYPNPTSGQAVRVESTEPLRSIELIDLTGKVLAHYSGVVRTIAAPEVAGTYLVRTTFADGKRSVGRLVRY